MGLDKAIPKRIVSVTWLHHVSTVFLKSINESVLICDHAIPSAPIAVLMPFSEYMTMQETMFECYEVLKDEAAKAKEVADGKKL